MFDTAKVQQMLVVLERFAREREEIYVIPEWLNGNAFALFRRMGVAIRAVLLNAPQTFPQKEIFGCPIMLLNDAARHFTPKTGIILLSAKPQPNFLNAATFTLGNQRLNVPIFAATSDEVLALYDRLTLIKVLQQYGEDGIYFQPKDLATRFARGLTTFLNPDFENVKIQFWDRNSFAAPKYDVEDTAIVLRGQIVYENRYTEKTLEFYRSVYPKTPIVVSTWKNELTDDFREACKRNAVVLLENIQPATPGFGHLNYQLETAFNGVEYVKKKLDPGFILVTRTDQRLNKFDFLLYFRNMILEFPPHGKKLQGRILTFGDILAKKYLPFSSTDFLAFGYAADILKFYDLPRLQGSGEHSYYFLHSKRFYKMRDILQRATFKKFNFAEQRLKLKRFNVMINRFVDADIFWIKNFYRKYIAPIDETTILETWLKFIRKYLLFVDSSSVFFDWAKHETFRYQTLMERTDFSQWLDLYRHFNVDWV